jgi:YihY family inner membrane protein
MDLLRPLRAFDRVQQRTRFLAVPIAVVKKFADDQAGGLAALVAYYAFFSIFPLMLVFVTILGYVFHGDPSTQESIKNSVLGHLPIIGNEIQTHELQGSALTLVIGVLFLLWAGLGVTTAAQNAFDRIWAVPFKERPNFFKSKLRGFALVSVLGLLFVLSSLSTGLVTGGLGNLAVKLGAIGSSLLLNLAILAAAFRLLTAAAVPSRSMWIGVLVGAVLWTGLEAIGGWYVSHVLKNASATYGVFALSIGLLVWLHVGAQATLYAAELNVVLIRSLWPRSLLSPPLATDEKTLTALAKVEERTERETIEVHFEPEPTAVKTGDRPPRA